MEFYIVGTSALSEIITEILISQNKIISGYFDDFNKKPQYQNRPIIGSILYLIDNKSKFANAHFFVAIGDNNERAKVYLRLKKEGFCFFNVIHSRAFIEESAIVGEGNYIGCFSYVGTSCIIGDANIIFKGVSITHHNVLGNFNFLSPNVSIGGYTEIENNVKVGMNCVIKPYIKIKSELEFPPLTLVD